VISKKEGITNSTLKFLQKETRKYIAGVVTCSVGTFYVPTRCLFDVACLRGQEKIAHPSTGIISV